MARALNTEDAAAGAVLTVVLEPDDPLALARVIEGGIGKGLLIEPYFRLDQLLPVVQYTTLTRVLTSERVSEPARNALKLGVEALTLDREFEVRLASRELHDRYVIPDAGRVQFIGSSLNSLGRVATAMGTFTDATTPSGRYGDMWDASARLALAKLPSTGTDGSSQGAEPDTAAHVAERVTKATTPKKTSAKRTSARRTTRER